MYENIILEILENFWKLGIPEDLIERELFNIDELFIKPRKIITIVGMRRVGKTYALYQIIKNLLSKIPQNKIFYINFEDERIPRDKTLLSDLTSIMRNKAGRLSDAFIFLDEPHEIPEWDRWLFRLYEREKPIIVLTGSTSKLASWNMPRELRGRGLTYRLFPLRLSEFLKFKGIKEFQADREDARARSSVLLEEYLRFGGLPEVVLSPTQRKLRILQDYYWAIITRDIAERKKVENLSILNTVLKYIVNTVYFSASRLHNILKSAGYRIGKNTILDYAGYAEEVFFLNQLPQYHERASQKIIAPRKIYVGDNGFITALATKKANMGRLLENAVFLELQRRYYLDPTIEISYMILKSGEIDFVISRGLETIELIQVCYDPTDIETKQREIPPLLTALKKFGLKKGTVITANYKNKEKYGTKEINYIPYSEWETYQYPSEHQIPN